MNENECGAAIDFKPITERKSSIFPAARGIRPIREAYQCYISPGFTHHNPYFNGDADTLMLAMEENAEKNPDKILEVRLAIQENETVVVHSDVKQNPEDRGGAVVHIFRFQGGQVAELWDVGQPVPEDSPNENGMF